MCREQNSWIEKYEMTILSTPEVALYLLPHASDVEYIDSVTHLCFLCELFQQILILVP